MRRITDASFRYTPSYATDIRKTFARARRTLGREPQAARPVLGLLPAQREVQRRLDLADRKRRSS